jgi:hypothetical protein
MFGTIKALSLNAVWKLKILDDDNKVNGNKLRTYRKLKLEYETDFFFISRC